MFGCSSSLNTVGGCEEVGEEVLLMVGCLVPDSSFSMGMVGVILGRSPSLNGVGGAGTVGEEVRCMVGEISRSICIVGVIGGLTSPTYVVGGRLEFEVGDKVACTRSSSAIV